MLSLKDVETKIQNLSVTKKVLEKELQELNVPVETVENISTEALMEEIMKLEKILKEEGINL